MEPQPQAIRPNEAEQTGTSNATTAEPQPPMASSAVAAPAGASATTAEPQPQVASSAEAEQTSTSPTTEGTCHKTEPLPWYFKLAFAFVIVSWLVLLSLGISSKDFDWSDLTKLGLLGDSFGVLNTLFSGLAFLAIIISTKLQRDDLRLQQVEAASQRVVLKDQAEEAKLQREEMQSQRKLAQEYQNERFFVLLLEQIKGKSIIDTYETLVEFLNNCYSHYDDTTGDTISEEDRDKIYNSIRSIYFNIHEPQNYFKHDNIVFDFLYKITEKYNSFQTFFDSVTHINEFIQSLPNKNTQKNYARIVYTSLGQYDRLIIFMYLVAQYKMVNGDFFGDLLFTDYQNIGDL